MSEIGEAVAMNDAHLYKVEMIVLNSINCAPL